MSRELQKPVRIPETDQEALIDDLVEKHDGEVIRLSQRRASNVTVGISDRQYYIFDRHVVFEVKAEDGRLTHDQYHKLALHHRSGGIACCGTINDMRVLIPAVRRSLEEGRALGWRLIELWAARGFRREKKDPMRKPFPDVAPF